MITPSKIYWITRLDEVRSCIDTYLVLFTIAAAICILLVSIISVMILDLSSSDDYSKRLTAKRSVILKILFCTVAIDLLLATVSVFIPSTKEMAAIIVLPRVANSQTVRELGDGVVGLAKEWLEELKPKKEKEVAK